MGHEAKNVLFCLKNVGLAKEPGHTPAPFLKQNDIVVDWKYHSRQMRLSPPRVVVETWLATSLPAHPQKCGGSAAIRKFCSRMPCGKARNRRARHCKGARQSRTGTNNNTSHTGNPFRIARTARSDIWRSRCWCSWSYC